MAAQIYTTGPVNAFAQFYNGTAYYIGTCETSPDIKFQPRTLEVKNDLGGRSLPFQRTYDGQDAVVTLIMTRWDEDVVNLLVNQPFHNVAPQDNENRLARGSLFIGVGSFRLILQHSFFGTPQGQPGLRAGYRFHAAHVAAHTPTPAGTQAQIRGVVFQCDNLWDPSTGSFLLYDQNNDIATAFARN